MSKRLSDTEKWSDSWFVELSLAAKSLFLFLCDMCDIAGFYERSDKIMKFYLSFNKNTLNKATAEISKSVIFKNGVYFVKNFIAHQKNLPLNLNNHCHIGIIQRLKKRSKDFYDFYDDEIKISLAPNKGLGSPYGKGKGKGKGTGTGKDVDSRGGVGGKKEPIKYYATFDFEAFWKLYPTRNGKKVGKQETHDKFNKLITTPEDYNNLIIAVKNYRICEQVENGYAKDPVRFLKNEFWKDWLTRNDNPAYIEPEPDNTPHLSEADQKIQDEFYKLPLAEQEKRKRENNEKLIKILKSAFK